MRRSGHKLTPFTLFGLLCAAFLSLVAGPDNGSDAPSVAASASPVPLIFLDATNPSSYPGTGTTVTNLGSLTQNGQPAGSGTIVGSVGFNSTEKTFTFPGGTNGTSYINLNANIDNFSSGLSIEFEGEFGTTRSIWERIFDFSLGMDSPTFTNVDDAMWVGQLEGTNELAFETRINGGTPGYCYSATGGTALGPSGDRTLNKFMITVGDVGGTVKCRIYKNGVELHTLYSTYVNPFPIASAGANIGGSPYSLPRNVTRISNFVGRSNFVADNDLEGSIRYLRIYNQVLTPQQVAVNATRTVTFDANGGVGTMASQASNAPANLTTNAFTRTGYTFAGWNTVQGGGGTAYGNGASYPFTADETLFAQWTGNVLTVSYNANGGSTPSGGSSSTASGATMASLATTSRAGYTFAGWFTAASGGTQVTTSAGHGQTADFTLFAQWTANTLTVTYDSQSGSAVSAGSTTTGASIAASPGSPTRAGYTFDGWFTATSGGSRLSFPYVHGQTANFTLFAQWTANTLTVTYDAQGGSSPSGGSASTTTGATMASLPTTSRAGYTFDGWFTAASGGTQVTTTAGHGHTVDFTLFAQWTSVSATSTTTTSTTIPVTTTSTTPPAASSEASGSDSTTTTTTTVVSTTSSTGRTSTRGGVGADEVSVDSSSDESPRTENDLADTGANVRTTARWSVILLVFGVGLTLSQRRRRQLLNGARPIRF